MSKHLQERILTHLKSEHYRPQKRRPLAKQLNVATEDEYEAFKEAPARRSSTKGASPTAPATPSCCPAATGRRTRSSEPTGRTSAASASSCRPIRTATKTCSSRPATTTARSPATSCARRSPTNRWREGKPMWSGQDHRNHQAHQQTLRRLARQDRRHVDGLSRRQHAHRADPHARRRGAAHQAGHEGRRRADDTIPSEASTPQGVITEVLGEAGEKRRRSQDRHRAVQPAGRVSRRACSNRRATRSIRSIRKTKRIDVSI